MDKELRIFELKQRIASREAVIEAYARQNHFPEKVIRRREDLENMKKELAALDAKPKKLKSEEAQ